jgi:hypothetical protein
LPVGAGLCRSVLVCAGRCWSVPVGAGLCRLVSVPVPVFPGADRCRPVPVPVPVPLTDRKKRCKPMGLFPKKYRNQILIQSQLYQTQKMIFYNDKIIYTQNLKFFLNNFTELRYDFYSLRYLRLNHRSITVFLLNKPIGLYPSIYGNAFRNQKISKITKNENFKILESRNFLKFRNIDE